VSLKKCEKPHSTAGKKPGPTNLTPEKAGHTLLVRQVQKDPSLPNVPVWEHGNARPREHHPSHLLQPADPRLVRPGVTSGLQGKSS
jgi:hypothetical protein